MEWHIDIKSINKTVIFQILNILCRYLNRVPYCFLYLPLDVVSKENIYFDYAYQSVSTGLKYFKDMAVTGITAITYSEYNTFTIEGKNTNVVWDTGESLPVSFRGHTSGFSEWTVHFWM